MRISIREKDLYAELKGIGYDSLDVKFPLWDARDLILSDEIDRVFSKKYEKIREAGLSVCQTHLTYYPGHLPPIGDGSYEADVKRYDQSPDIGSRYFENYYRRIS